MPIAIIFRKPPQSALRRTFQAIIKKLKKITDFDSGYSLTVCSGYFTSHQKISAPSPNHIPWFAQEFLLDIQPIVQDKSLKKISLIGCKSGVFGNSTTQLQHTDEFIENYNYIQNNVNNVNNVNDISIELRLPVNSNGEHYMSDVHSKIILLSVISKNEVESPILAFVGSSNMTAAAFGSDSKNPSIETDVLIVDPLWSGRRSRDGGLSAGLKSVVKDAREALQNDRDRASLERRDVESSEEKIKGSPSEADNEENEDTNNKDKGEDKDRINLGQTEIIYVSGVDVNIGHILQKFNQEICQRFQKVNGNFWVKNGFFYNEWQSKSGGLNRVNKSNKHYSKIEL